MTTNDTSNYSTILGQVMQTDRDVLNSQLQQANAIASQNDAIKKTINDTARYTDNAVGQVGRDVMTGTAGVTRDIIDSNSIQTDSLKKSINDTARYTDNAIGQVGRDVLTGTGLITRDIIDSNSGQTNSLKQSMNDIARFTDGTINSLNRDVLKGHSDLGDSLKTNVNSNFKFTDNMINGVDKDLLKGNFQVTDSIKNSLADVGDKMEDRFSSASRDLLSTQFMQTNDLKNNLAQIDKDIYKSTGMVNENVKDAIRDINTSSAQLAAQNLRDLNGINSGIIDRVTNATGNIESNLNHARAQSDAQFFNSADRIDRTTAELKSTVNAGFINDVMLTKETQRDLLGGVNSIERQSAAQYAGLQRDIDRTALFHEHRNNDFRRDYFEQSGRQNRHAAEYQGIIRRDISEGHYRTENEILRSRNQIEVQAAQNYANVQIEALKNKDALSIQAAASLAALQNQNAQNYANIQIEAFKNKEGLASQAAQNYANSQIELLKAKDALALQNAQGFAATQLEASKNTASILDKLAECCCEVKEAVITTSATTQDTVKNSELAAVRQLLTAEQTKNFILQTVDKH